MKFIRCNSCSGSGSTNCITCSGRGHSICQGCGGGGYNWSGQSQISCNSCNGRRAHSCSNCGGSGHWNCNNCRGSGTIPDYSSENSVIVSIPINYGNDTSSYNGGGGGGGGGSGNGSGGLKDCATCCGLWWIFLPFHPVLIFMLFFPGSYNKSTRIAIINLAMTFINSLHLTLIIVFTGIEDEKLGYIFAAFCLIFNGIIHTILAIRESNNLLSAVKFYFWLYYFGIIIMGLTAVIIAATFETNTALRFNADLVAITTTFYIMNLVYLGIACYYRNDMFNLDMI